MPLGKSTLDVGKLYIADLDRHSHERLTAEEIAALVFQAGEIFDRLGRIADDQPGDAGISLLAQYLRPCYVEAVAKHGGSAMVCANVRRHQAELYSEHLGDVRRSVVTCIRDLIVTARNSGQWWWWASEHVQLLRAKYYLASLYRYGVLYRMGARVRVDDTLKRLSLICHVADGGDGRS